MGVWAYGRMGVWVYRRMGVWVYRHMGVWAYGRMGVSAYRKGSDVTLDLDLGPIGIRKLALKPTRRHADSDGASLYRGKWELRLKIECAE